MGPFSWIRRKDALFRGLRHESWVCHTAQDCLNDIYIVFLIISMRVVVGTGVAYANNCGLVYPSETNEIIACKMMYDLVKIVHGFPTIFFGVLVSHFVTVIVPSPGLLCGNGCNLYVITWFNCLVSIRHLTVPDRFTPS